MNIELTNGGRDCPVCLGTKYWPIGSNNPCITCDGSGKIK